MQGCSFKKKKRKDSFIKRRLNAKKLKCFFFAFIVAGSSWVNLGDGGRRVA